ncbi:MAG: TauD/TfdA family dioxygenase [Alphaproteobacteria bacterium]
MARELTEVKGSSAWKSRDLGAARSWVRSLTPRMAAEIEAAVRAVKAAGIPFNEIARADFPLRETADLLAESYDDLNAGRGFAVIGGFPAGRFGYDESLLAYGGLAAYLGRIVVQNYEGQLAVDVIDKGIPYDHKSRGYSSNKLLPFHTDGADYAGLLCLGEAAEGGLSLIASAAAIYNEILRTRPDHMETLLRGFYHHRRGQHDPGENPLSPERVPVFSFRNGLLHCCYNRNPIEWAQKEGVALSAAEVEALDHLDSLCARPEYQLSMGLRKGDLQFINNYLILHSRTEYRDDATHRRHLVRLWMHDEAGLRNGVSLLDLYVPKASRFRAAG